MFSSKDEFALLLGRAPQSIRVEGEGKPLSKDLTPLHWPVT